MDSSTLSVTAKSPINIAVVKYWGKVDEKLVVPLNNSISMTLNTDDLCSTTTVELVDAEDHSLELNGETAPITNRLLNMIQQVHDLIPEEGTSLNGVQFSKADLISKKIKVTSLNNFPTAAGVASSSSGLSCLAACLSKLYNLQLSTERMTILARLGSGSSCRSLEGGFVEWQRGFDDVNNLPSAEELNEKSVAVQVLPETEWTLGCLICIVQSEKKHISSTEGMRKTMETSDMLKEREAIVVPQALKDCHEALEKKDFSLFAKMMMDDSDSLHACMADTTPTIVYMNDCTRTILQLCKEVNEAEGRAVMSYTVDAGANCFLICQMEDLPRIYASFQRVLDLSDANLNERCVSLSKDDPIAPEVFAKHKEALQPIKSLIGTSTGKGVKFIE